MSDAQDEPLGPGIHRVLADPEVIVATLPAAGWRTAVVPGVSSTAEFYTAIAAALGFGDYFGRNLDALWDCLTDLDRPTAVVLLDWDRYARAHPRHWSAIQAVLQERTEQQPAFAVLLV